MDYKGLQLSGELYSHDEDDKTVDINFEGHYLIQFSYEDGIVPTGNAMDGNGSAVGYEFFDNAKFNVDINKAQK